MPQNQPLISIITVCFNTGERIRQNIRSVAEQTYTQIEHVIIDGKSTDRTLEIIQSSQPRLGTLISEKDRGIYDAMNKGVEKAKGDFFLFLNSDDWLTDASVISDCVREFETEATLIHGKMKFHDRDGTHRIVGGPSIRLNKGPEGIHQPCTFFHREIFKRHGNFDPEFRISGDYEFYCRVVPREKVQFLDKVITNMSDGGASTKRTWIAAFEDAKIQSLYGQGIVGPYYKALKRQLGLYLRERLG